VYNLKYALFIFFLLFLVNTVNGQNLEEKEAQIETPNIDHNTSAADSAVADKSPLNNNEKKPQGDITTTIKYTARDSINFDVVNQIVYLYGDAKIDYGDVELEAGEIVINWHTHTLTATSRIDSLGKKEGVPVFKDGPETYVTQNIKYNFKTKKAIISGMVTQQGDAFMHGEKIKKTEDSELYIDHAKYTTCNLEDPHFHIAANKLKVIQNDKIISGPFNLVFNDIPTPLGFAFGMFPAPKKRTSGILIPTYGEERTRGFFLRDGGFFLALNDHVNLALRGDIYSKGSYGFNVASEYRKRYAYNGNFSFRHTVNYWSPNIEDSTAAKDYWINWTHAPQSKGNSRFSASVNGGSSSFTQNNLMSIEQNINTTFNSSVNFSHTFAGTPFNMAVSARHNQNVRTGQMDMTLPEMSLNMNRIFPFKKAGSSGKSWYEKISVAHTFNTTNRLTNMVPNYSPNAIAPDTALAINRENIPVFLERASIGARHSVPITTTFNMFKHFAISPSVNYEELWYLRELNHRYNEETQRMEIDTLNRFSRAYSYGANIGATTRLYGTIYPKSEKILGIRHVMIPTLGFSARPDFSHERYGYYKEVQVDSTGRKRMVSRYDGFVYGAPGMGKSASFNFSLNNNLEMKVRTKNDSTGNNSKKVSILDNLSMSTSYNVLADSFQLAPIRLAARTRLFNNKLDVNFASTVDPYTYELISESYNTNGDRIVQQRRRSDYAWNNGGGIGRISQAMLSLGTNLNPAARGKDKKNTTATPEEMEFINANPDLYVDFNIPWSLRLNYNINYSKTGFADPNIMQTLNFSGDVSLTEKWKIGFSSGYDFVRKDLTMTNINIYRDLHCWELRFNWVPFGRFTSFSLDIQVKAPILQDLKLSRRRNFGDNFVF
jgi:hypothetical protein